MPLQSSPTFNAVATKDFLLNNPAIGGLNLKDLSFKQNPNQSPYMLNMMYRNGTFSKRYGQKFYGDVYIDEIYETVIYRNSLFVHSGTNIYKDGVVLATGMPNKKGLFVLYNQNLYYFCGSLYEYDGIIWKSVEPYVPTVVINRKPDGTGGDTIDAYNMIGKGFQNNFHGDNSSTKYVLTDANLDETTPKVTINNDEWTYDPNLSADKTFKVDYEKGEITLKSAAPEGINNVEIIAYKRDEEWDSYYEQIMNSKFYSCFGGNNNSRLFLAGGGKSTYYYSEVYDAAYFPYTNYAKVGNSADDITGFGQQYNVLIVFKPTEVYSLTYYQNTSSTTTDESQIGRGAFASQVVNSAVGCDCPNSIQLINNQLTWFSTREGICTLVSTNIIDERNVRPISININQKNSMGVLGLLDYSLINGSNSLCDKVQSVDFDNKYFLCIPSCFVNGEEKNVGICFMWDYKYTPFNPTNTKSADPSSLSWYLLDNIHAKQFFKLGDDLVFVSSKDTGRIKMFDNFYRDQELVDGEIRSKAIKSYYMTPYMEFNGIEYLKTIKNMFVQSNGDVASKIDITYYTNDDSNGVRELEPIVIYANLWKSFLWSDFGYSVLNIANTFRRKCSIKKVQLFAVKFENDVVDCDMSLSFIGFEYQYVKRIK